MRSKYEIENIFLAGLYTPSRKLMALNAETWTDEETAHVTAIKETICNGDTEDAVLARYEDEDRILESIEAERNRYFVTECAHHESLLVDLIKKLAKSLNSLSDEEFEKILKSDPFS